MVVIHILELLAAPDVRPNRNATPSDQRLPAWPDGDAVGREERSPGRPMRPLPDALLAICHPRVDAPPSWRLRQGPPLASPSDRLRRGSYSS